MENEFVKDVLNTINKYKLIQENDKVVIGVSGGPDSICLLHVLNNIKSMLNFEIVVAHINHQIRPEADEETEYVKEFCDKLNVKCFVRKIDVIKKAENEKIGTEEAGRYARYEFFEEVLKQENANKIATAHNANDNAETVLMNIFRGTSTAGLKGIEPIRDEKFIRPLIECNRNDIENYCKTNNLQPRIDKSNFENIYTRNKIRNILIPQIKKDFNSNIIEALNKLSCIAREENSFVDSYIENVINEKLIINDLEIDNGVVINLKEFNKLDNYIKSRAVLSLIQKVLGTTQGIEKKHVDDIVLMCAKNIGNKYLKPNKHIKVMVNGGKVYFTTE